MEEERDVVGNKRNIERIEKNEEMIDDIGMDGDCIERRSEEERIGEKVIWGFWMGNKEVGRRVYEKGNERKKEIRKFKSMLKNNEKVWIVIEKKIDGGKEGKKEMEEELDKMLEKEGIGIVIERMVIVKRSEEGREKEKKFRNLKLDLWLSWVMRGGKRNK